MVDIASLDVAATGAFSRFHNYTKNIETAHLGHAYSSVLDNLDHYVIKGVAEPVLSKAPEWVSDNRVVTAIRSHQGISIAVGAALTLISLVSLWIWLHPAGKTTTSINTNPPNTTLPPSGDDDETDSVDGDDDKLNVVPDLADDATKTDGTAEGGKRTSATGGERSEESDEEDPAGVTGGTTGDGERTKAANKKGSEDDEDPFAKKPVTPRDAGKTSKESSATASGAEEEDEGVRKDLNSLFTTEEAGGGVTGKTTVGRTDEFDALLEELQASRTEGATLPPQLTTPSYASVVAGGGEKPPLRTDERTRSAPSTPTHVKPPVEPVWISTAGYGTGFSPNSNSTRNGSKAAVVDDAPKSGGKKKKKGRGKKANK